MALNFGYAEILMGHLGEKEGILECEKELMTTLLKVNLQHSYQISLFSENIKSFPV
jgi:hypothetical protein